MGFMFCDEKLKPNFITRGRITKMQNAAPHTKRKVDINTVFFINFLSFS